LRVLITGASGFAGGYLGRACSEAGDEVVGVSRRGTCDGGQGIALDLRDNGSVRELVREFQPEVLYHLAALSSVGRSWEQPAETMEDNVATAVSVLEAIRAAAPRARLVWISSCEVYGPPEHLPVGEDAPIRPANPYAVSKAAGELLADVYAQAHDLDIVRLRPFSHAGPGQQPIFIVSSIARQAARGRLERAETIEIVTGNAATRRDFTDVRDVVGAYRLAAEHAGPGTYNVSSGASVSAAEQVALAAELLAPARVNHVVDPGLVRAHEVPELAGANERLRAATGWRPEISLSQTLSDTIAWWEHQLAT
jgi:GDP-4-dehydro-6-deoxy-D-mannose reductase